MKLSGEAKREAPAQAELRPTCAKTSHVALARDVTLSGEAKREAPAQAECFVESGIGANFVTHISFLSFELDGSSDSGVVRAD